MGVPGAFVWAVLAFVTNFIPNIGFIIGVIPPALFALLEGGPGLMVAVIVVYRRRVLCVDGGIAM